jgi:chitinase
MSRSRMLGVWMLGAVLLAACGGAPEQEPADEVGAPGGESPAEAVEVQDALVGSVSVFADALGTGWSDWSWAQRSLVNRTPVASGARSIAVTFGPWTGLYLHHAGLTTAEGDALELQVNGGGSSNPALNVYVTVGGAARPQLALAPWCAGGRIPSWGWTQCRIPLGALGAAGVKLDGVVLIEAAGRSLPALYVDDVRLVAAAPAPVAVSLSPASVTLPAGGTQTFVATVSGTTNKGVTWSVQEGSAGGSVSTAGAYKAPQTAGTYHVVATSSADVTKKASATLTVTAGTPPPPTPTPSSGKWVAGYYVGYQQDLYPVDKVDFSALTHLMVSRVTPNVDGTLNTGFDTYQGEQMATALTTRAHAAGRKAVLMVGGAGEHGGWVGAASDANRARFVQNLLSTMDRLGFDGLDLDWEPVEQADKPLLLALARQLRSARPGMLLTFPIGWQNSNAGSADPWYATLAQSLDQVNVMSYDMAGAWEGWASWHNSALTGHGADHPSSIASSLSMLAATGIPKAKLGMGIAFYGMAWRNVSGPLQRIGSASDLKASDNYVTYAYVMRHYSDAAYRWDASAQASYLSFSSPVDGDVRFISYESPQAIAAKGQYARDQGYGGTIVWTINQGCTNPTTGANPPLDAVKAAFLP